MAKQSNVKSRRKLLNPIFHLQTKSEDDSQLTQGMIKIVRKTGQLNLSGRSLAHVPERLFSMYELVENEEVNLDFNKMADEDNWWDFKPLTFLDLSANVIREIPEQIVIFDELNTLNLENNNLTNLPPQIGKLTKLTKLNLNHNKLINLPDEFYRLTDLEMLTISYNCLETISRYIGDLVMLQHLDLSHNSIVKLPPGIGYLVRLKEINLSYNKLKKLPPDIVNLRCLTKLDVSNNELISLPKMSELTKLQLFYVENNQIEDIPDFYGCNNLQQIFLGNNLIKKIPVEFCENLPFLKILDLKNNLIEELPEEIAMLQKLIRLDLTNNKLLNLPNSLGLLPHLQNLQLDGNILKNIRADIIKNGTVRILKYLREKLENEEQGNNLTKTDKCQIIPEPQLFPDKYQIRNARSLNLAMKQLTCVPDYVFENVKWADCTIVDFCKNRLENVPNGIEIIADSLTELNLSMNQLIRIPEFFGNFTKLNFLDLSGNCLSFLPKSMETLVGLRELVLSNNKLTVVPDCIYAMIGLEILLLNNNKITEINVAGLQNLKRIATLDLSNNNISQIPPELGNLKQLRCLELKGNCFRQPRYAILEQGTETILSYLRDRIPK